MSYQEEIQNLNIQISSLHAEEKEKISQEPDVEKHAGKIDAINKQIADLIVKEMEENILNAKRVNDLLQTVWTKSMIMKLTDIEVLELFGVFGLLVNPNNKKADNQKILLDYLHL